MTSLMEFGKNVSGMTPRGSADVQVDHQTPPQLPSAPPPAYSLPKSSTYQTAFHPNNAATPNSVDLEAQSSRRSDHLRGPEEPEQNPAEKRSALRLRGGCCCCDCLYDLLRCLLCCCIFEAICDMCC